jgi:hypothetical protein
MAEKANDQEPGNASAAPVVKKRFGGLTWEKGLEIAKIGVTLYAACFGTIVTMQFNERQHELARLEAIAKMLPHLAQDDKPEQPKASVPKSVSKDTAGQTSGPEDDSGPSKGDPDPNPVDDSGPSKSSLARNGAMWAIFRTANNKTMMTDLASLFPEDIYRVVSSIATSGGIEHDDEAMTALQVSSEKLANRYSDQNKPEIAARLYNQALHLKERHHNSNTPLTIIDLNEPIVQGLEGQDTLAETLKNLNRLGEIHLKESEGNKKVNTGRWNAKQLFKRVRQMGLKSQDKKARLEVAKADYELFILFSKDKRPDTADKFLQEALQIKRSILGANDPEVLQLQEKATEITQSLKEPVEK